MSRTRIYRQARETKDLTQFVKDNKNKMSIQKMADITGEAWAMIDYLVNKIGEI